MRKQIATLALSLILLTSCTSIGISMFGQNVNYDANEQTSTGISNEQPTKIHVVQGTSSLTGSDSDGSLPSQDEKDPHSEQKLSEKPDTGFALVVSGDAMSHDNSWKSALQDDGSFDYMPQYQDISHLLDRGDLTLVNMETPVSGEEYGYSGFPLFNAPLNFAETLKKVGVDMVITANNHALDNGVDGLKSYLDNLDELGMLHTGAARSPEEAEAPYILEINGIRAGFATSTSKVTMEVPVDYAVPLNKKSVLRGQIQALREAGAELIIYHIHWGKEYTEYPSQFQMDMYQVLEEEGVDIVIGSHPHRLQPMEIRKIEYEGKVKDQAVIWSTANMSWGGTQRYDYVNTGAVFEIQVERKDNKIQVVSMDYDLIYNLNTKTENKVKYIKLIPEADKELYRESHPEEYEKMLREFEWAHKTLNGTVDLHYSDQK